MKNIFISTLFLSFTFGQNLNVSEEIVGLWRVKGTSQSYIYQSDGSGIYNILLENKKTQYKFSWSIINSNKNNALEPFPTGTLVQDFSQCCGQIYVYNFIYRSKKTIDPNLIKELNELWILRNESWNGGDLLILWEANYTYEQASDFTFLEKY